MTNRTVASPKIQSPEIVPEIAPRRGIREIDVLALVAALLCLVFAWSSRNILNPDGVSYFDLASALRRGDVARFVQGYWSPLYPLLLAGVGGLTRASVIGMMSVGHAINALAMLAAVAGVWWWARSMDNPFFGRAAMAALLLCGAGMPQIEAVTPDVIVVAVAVWLSHELVRHGGRHWRLCGLLLGVGYLAKTGIWPWVVLVVLVRLVLARDRAGRVLAMRIGAVAALVMLAWLVPMSVRAHHPTVGSTGSLNFGWYVRGEIARRTPDTDPGDHVTYRTVVTPAGTVTAARFDDAAAGTYPPWSDPTSWAAGLVARDRFDTPLAHNFVLWGAVLWDALRYWLSPVLLSVLLPMAVVARRRGAWRELARNRDWLALVLLGAAGLAEFIAVHAEPRLVAPFVAMIALGALAWLCAAPPAPRGAWQVASVLGLLVAVAMAAARLKDDSQTNAHVGDVIAALTGPGGTLDPMAPHPRVVIVGEAVPLEAPVYWIGGRVAGQLLPRSLPAFTRLPVEQRNLVLDSLFGGRADVAWQVGGDGRLQFTTISAGTAAR